MDASTPAHPRLDRDAPARPDRPTVSLVSLGCSKNQVDSERMLGGLVQRGYRYEPDSLQADLVVVNTCGFIGPARDQSVETILQYARLKQERPGMRLVVAGCMVERYAEELVRELPEVDSWLGGLTAEELDRVAREHLGPDVHPMQSLGPRSVLLNDPGMAYLRISQGCDRTCSFCAIPGFKGRQVSVPLASLVEEAGLLVEDHGARELVLVGQDPCRYGTDLGGGTDLTALCEALLGRTRVRWLRLLYAYPFSLPDGVLELMAGEERMLGYLEMPFQHADSGVLRTMRRGHGGERFLEYLGELRARIPHLVCRSTMLVGHPGEDEAAFAVLEDFVARARFEWMGVFEYSDEEGTHAATLGGAPGAEVARRRARRLTRRWEESRSLEAFRLGTEQDALVVRRDGEAITCRLRGQAPEVDGQTYLTTLDPDIQPGDMIRVVPERADGLDLIGTLAGGAAPMAAGRGRIEV